jgi:uncharacterized sulfatase
MLFLMVLSLAVSARAERPNILFILADDLGYGDLGSYGNTFCDTPNLDRLAAEGMRFTAGYAAAPICSASRAAALTGKTPARLGFEFVTKNPDDYGPGWTNRYPDKQLVPPVYTLNLPLEERTLAEVLGDAGYETGITGKWHVSAHHDRYLGWSPTHGPKAQGFDWAVETFGAHPYGQSKAERKSFGEYKKGAYPPDELTDQAIAFMKRDREKPFFLMVSHYYVHTPLGTRCQWLLDKYKARAADKHSEERAEYGAFVETLDHYVGQLLAGLEEAGLADNTLVVFTSDNGGHPAFAFNVPLRGSKWNLYEGGIRVPFIVRWPGRVVPGSTCDTPVSSTDLLPTFHDVAGAEIGDDAWRDGASILAALEGGAGDSGARTFYWHFPYYHPERKFDDCPAEIGVEDGYVSRTYPQSAMRKGRYKLLYFYEDDRCELYDLDADMAEQHDLSEAKHELLAELRQDLMGYLETVDARLPLSHAAYRARHEEDAE